MDSIWRINSFVVCKVVVTIGIDIMGIVLVVDVIVVFHTEILIITRGLRDDVGRSRNRSEFAVGVLNCRHFNDFGTSIASILKGILG